jgi:ectoine hydroxylase-related dioxygenase (phytanoyl-CoA dioxygenase family)
MPWETSFEADRYAEEFVRVGYSISERVLSPAEVEYLRAAVAGIQDGDEVCRRRGVYGVRNLLEICPAIEELARQTNIRRFVTPVLGESAFAVRAIFFDKVPGANWSLFWHQDNVISVAARVEVAGYTGWSNKAGVWQVQPPAEVLARMVAVRVHLDDCGPDNGPLRVLPGSHRFGWLDEQIDEWKERVPEVICAVRCGGVVTMCPLILHASAKSAAVGHRRVIHIEYASEDLPECLEWNNRVVASFTPNQSHA